ncbi:MULTISPECIES: TspO/MBR family protein [Prosthecochloris]|uniref:Sensory protein TspO n=1 Tax=Prosthecochloris marina TaxID=2017681 RepID=A0A317T4L5_9CHLB|nr:MULTISPECIES: TspO/MBR family protein [Prosthecochloris]PWW81662.1 sensory protein TspO [Prosthecochloris marina]UZJ37109.1 tryptophan-rich sensory protein [Prosthecochloris sp. SCSIO W1103]UZJ40087.1 tryptophan-rich sensory protein [Prosthecochloris sp. SCSIO W1102]
MNLNPVVLIACIGLCLLIGFAGSAFTPQLGAEWYYSVLKKPSWNPPDWLFAPVWTVLFILMGVSLFLVIKDGLDKPGVVAALIVFFVQLYLNFAWSAVFFGLQSPFGGFLEIVALWLSIVLTIILFGVISTTAAYLLIPYLLWVSFASYLTFTIWNLNL